MRLARYALAALAASLIAATAFAQTVEREVAPLPRLFPHWQDYLDLPVADRSHFTLAYVVDSTSDIELDEIRIWYRGEAGDTVLDIAPDGLILNPPDAPTLQAAPMIWVSQPAGSMSVSMGFQARFDTGTQIDRRDTLLALEQANHAMRVVGGVAALFAPALKTLVFVFDGTAPEAWAIRTDGSRTPLIVQEDRAFFRPGDRNLRDVERLEFGRPAMRILLDS